MIFGFVVGALLILVVSYAIYRWVQKNRITRTVDNKMDATEKKQREKHEKPGESVSLRVICPENTCSTSATEALCWL